VQYPGTRWDAVGPGAGIQLQGRCGKGHLLFPAIGRNIYSSDHGKNWRRSPKLPGGTSEATLVELRDGTLMRNDRASGHSLVAANRRPVSKSTDCGKTWTPWHPHAELPTVRVHGSLIRLDSRPGDVLVFANPASTERRRNMTIRLSNDAGKTWPREREIHAGTAGYPALAEIGGAAIGLLYEKGNSSAKSQGQIAFFRAPLAWLR